MKTNDGWYSPHSGQYVILSFWKGWIAAIKQIYPCNAYRLVNAETDEVVEEISGNGEVNLN